MKFTTVSYMEVAYGDLEKAINEAFDLPQPYEFAPDMECNNDIKLSVNVNGKLSDYDKKSIVRFIEGEGNYMAWRLMNDMCHRELIPPGKYLVSVSW